MKRKCKFCNETTNKPLNDFHEIGWSAYSLDGEKSICACPKHTKKLQEEMMNRLE